MTTNAILIMEAKGGAPEWFCILPMGEVKLADGRESFQVTPESLQAVMAAWQERGNDLVIDYEHQTMMGSEAPAAGWIKELEARDEGLWARVEWTDRALKYIDSKEYRYFSPVVVLGEGRQVKELLHAALTNYPALANLTPLAARMMAMEKPKQEAVMIEKLKVILGVDSEADVPVKVEQMKSMLAGWQSLGLGETLDQAKGAMLALTETKTRLDEAQGELQALKAEKAQKQAEDAVAAAMQAGKLAPAQREWALKYAGESPEGFRAYVEQAPKVVPLGDLQTGSNGPDQGGSIGAEDLAVCRALGVDPEKYKATRQAELRAAEEVH